MTRKLGWAILALLLIGTAVGAALFDRRSWPGLVGDEATYLVQAQSLAWDFDLRYSREDFDRFVAQWGRRPEGLILESGDGGATLSYSKPAAYAAYVAPFLRLSPTRGASIANALLLAFAAVVAARALARRCGPAAPWWVAAWVFGSVTFAYVVWVHADLFLMCLVALAYSLVYGGREDGPLVRRFLLAGALLGLVAMSRPFYATLLIPAALAVPKARRGPGLAAFAGGALAVVLISGLANLVTSGALTSYQAERQSFDSSVGFPEVELPSGSWQEQIAARGSHSWKPPTGFDGEQGAWNALYFLAGRHVGILPYYLPMLLGLTAFRRGEGRWAILPAVLIAAAGFLVLRPFNFYGGGGAIANRYFLPLYPATWFLAGRPGRVRWAGAAILAAAPFLLPLWQAPHAFLHDAEGGYAYVSRFAQRALPYETTLSHLKPSGREDFVHHGLWIKLLTTSLRPEGDGAVIRVEREGGGQLLVGSPQPLHGIVLRLEGREAEVLRPRLRAAHRMWWTDEPYSLYQVTVEAEAGARFTITPGPPPEPSPPGPLSRPTPQRPPGEGERGAT
jgi:hypothetical protein